jgi:hypothetical protein
MHDAKTTEASAALENGARALLILQNSMEQRELQLRSSIDQHLRSLRDELKQMQQRVDHVMGAAGEKIAQEAKHAVAPASAEYGRAVAAVTSRLQGVNKMVWGWFGAAGAVVLVSLVTGWVVLGYYRRELASLKEELRRYESAVPVVQAFYASDAVMCGGRICVNVDAKGQRLGDKRQYRQAKPRPGQ